MIKLDDLPAGISIVPDIFDLNGVATIELTPNGDCIDVPLELMIDGNFNDGDVINISLEASAIGFCFSPAVEGANTEIVLENCIGACDCENARVFGVDVNSETLLSEELPVTAAEDCISIHGTLIVDKNEHWFSKQVAMYPGSQIIVEANNTFFAFGSTFEGCFQMWKGIKVEEGASLGLVSYLGTKSVVRDAQYAVEAYNGAHLTITGTTFHNNYVGIYTPFSSSGHVVELHAPFLVDNEFTGPPTFGDDMLEPFEGQQPVPGARPHAGIWLHNTTGIDVGTPDDEGLTNFFFNLNTGIIANRGEMNVYNGEFRKLNTGIDLLNVAQYTQQECHFSDMNLGAQIRRSNVTINKGNIYTTAANNMTTRNGIRLENQDNRNTIITDNFFTCAQSGITIFNSFFPDITIQRNTINMNPDAIVGQTIGIGLFTVLDLSLGDININDINDITINSGTAIALTNCQGVSVRDNLISAANETIGFQIGIAVDGGNQIELVNNELEGNFLFAGIQIANTTNSAYCCNALKNTLSGLRFLGDCFDTNLRGTTFSGIQNTGLHLTQSAAIGDQPILELGQQPVLHGNKWENFSGLKARHDGLIEDDVLLSQFSANPSVPNTFLSSTEYQAVSNEWFNPLISAPTFACQGEFDCSLIGMLANAPTDTDIKIAEGSLNLGYYSTALNWTAQRYLYDKLTSNSNLLGQNQGINNFYNTASNGNLTSFRETQEGIMQLFQLETGIQAILDGYYVQLLSLKNNILNKNQQIIQANPTEQITLLEERRLLYDSLSLILQQSYSLLDLLETDRVIQATAIQAANDNTTATAIYEINEKKINDLFLNSLISSVESLDSLQLVELESIAGQCALSGGNSVYRARALLMMVKDTTFNDDLLCTQANLNEENIDTTSNQDENKDEINIFPNPAKEKLDIHIIRDMIYDCQLIVYNQIGQMVFNQPLKSNRTTLDTRTFGEGVFIFKIIMNGKIEYIERVIIIQ